MATTRRPTVSRTKKNAVDTHDVQVGQHADHIIKSTGDVERASVIVEAHNALDQSYAEELAFMEEVLEVQLSESTNPNDENIVYVSNNGISQYFIRGRIQQVKRKFVEVLARAKQTNVTTEEVNREVVLRRQTSLKYPFQVIYDPNPKGPAWLKGILTERA